MISYLWLFCKKILIHHVRETDLLFDFGRLKDIDYYSLITSLRRYIVKEN